MSDARTMTIILKHRERPPVTDEDRDTARIGLVQDAGRQGCILISSPILVSSERDDRNGLYEAVWYARVRLASTPWVPHRPGPALLALRAHRTSLHAENVITAHVTDALSSREPMAAAVALNLLGCPTGLGSFADHVAVGAATLPLLWPSNGEHQDQEDEGASP